MPKWAIVVLSVFALYGALSIAMSFFVMNGAPGIRSCKTYPVMSVESPSGEFQARVENSTCSPENELKSTVWLQQEGGNSAVSALIASSTQGTEGSYFPLYLRLTWQDDSRLQISYPQGTKVNSSAAGLNGSAKLDGITVSYSELSRNAF